jgi:hypothetical protein
MKNSGCIAFYGRHGGHDGWVGQDQTQMQATKQEPLWMSALQQGYEQRSQLMKRSDVSQVDMGIQNGMIVLTCWKSRQ